MKMIEDYVAIVLFSILASVCFAVVPLAWKDNAKGASVFLVLVGFFCISFVAFVGFNIGKGIPTNRIKVISEKPIYAVEARISYKNDELENKGIVVLRDAENLKSEFLIVKYNLREFPDANLVRLKDGKFVPFTLSPEAK
jgi:hypothetical protein